VHPICLPSHSSHFLQPLDRTVFGSFKSQDIKLRTRPAQPMIEGKLLRALQGVASVNWAGVIYSWWIAGRIEVRRRIHPDSPRVINMTKTGKISDANCQSDSDLLSENSKPAIDKQTQLSTRIIYRVSHTKCSIAESIV
jgi:hypothetical protein